MHYPQIESLIENLVKALTEDEKTGAAYARQLPNENCSFVEKYTRSFNYPDRSAVKTKDDLPVYGIKTFFCSNVCAAYKKEIYQKLGGFVRKAIFNEDMIYAGRLIQEGYGVAYAADAKVIHSHNYSCMQQFHRNFDLGCITGRASGNFCRSAVRRRRNKTCKENNKLPDPKKKNMADSGSNTSVGL